MATMEKISSKSKVSQCDRWTLMRWTNVNVVLELTQLIVGLDVKIIAQSQKA